MEKRTLAESFNTAIEGIIYTIKSQRNMKLHFLIAMVIVLLAIFLNIGKIETILLAIVIALVLIAEMFNTAVEKIIDLITPDFHPLARIVKDITAGCVLIATLNSIIVGYLVFSKYLIDFPLGYTLLRIKRSPWHVTFLSLVLVISLVMLGKAMSKKGKPLRGGMPSGHAAVAFSIWVVIVILTQDKLISFLSLILALLITQSRLRTKIHTNWEVITGGILGILVTILCFQIFS